MRNRSRFTLIEMLMVICIICILFSLLFPSFMKVRRLAEIAVCASNLKQLHTAHFLFARNNRDSTCPVKTNTSSYNINDAFGRSSELAGNGSKNQMDRKLNAYIDPGLNPSSALKVVDCPADAVWKLASQRGTSYNSNIGWVSGVMGTGNSGGHNPYPTKTFAAVRQPSKMMLVSEFGTYGLYKWDTASTGRHFAATNEVDFNIVRVDGSVGIKQRFSTTSDTARKYSSDSFHVVNVDPANNKIVGAP
ncbi:MAG: hypothetical protein RL095_1073 [Verrucomicrobiota bacterium]